MCVVSEHSNIPNDKKLKKLSEFEDLVYFTNNIHTGVQILPKHKISLEPADSGSVRVCTSIFFPRTHQIGVWSKKMRAVDG